MKKITNQDTFTPWIKMLERIYNCKVDWIQFPHSITKNTDYVELVKRNSMAPFIFSKNDVLFPVTKDKNLYGYIKVSQKDFPTYEFLDGIRDFIDLFIIKIGIQNANSSFFKLHKKGGQSKITNPSQISQTLLNNDVLLKDIKADVFADIKPEVMVNSEGLFPLLIEGESGAPTQELAYEIHHTSQRQVFITIDSGVESRITSSKDIEGFGAITLFIPNLPDLKKRTQIYLEWFLSSKEKPANAPRIIAAIKDRPENLLRSWKVFKPLFEILSRARIKISRRSKIKTLTGMAKSFDEFSNVTDTSQTFPSNKLRLVYSSKSTTLH